MGNAYSGLVCAQKVRGRAQPQLGKRLNQTSMVYYSPQLPVRFKVCEVKQEVCYIRYGQDFYLSPQYSIFQSGTRTDS
jgi:hypothetical protein